ncbi:transposase [Rubricoccus marinus]|uniref:Transposase IS200-like domain-containing protein n=1 Tax=Rubricoccus marinus TaxID=716817 RepID=A0A259TVE6_9BACT|nr:transposase [Rubricoccus marinus]OZC01701.1 hypothetical protein BSZ36_01105 [Rubricoccus marinus]
MPFRDRRSVRLRTHDYADGLYFITICTHRRQRLFGDVEEGEMLRSPLGDIAHAEWIRTEDVRPTCILDAFVVMPDHVHLLFALLPPEASGEQGSERRFRSPSANAASIVRGYKGAVTRAVWDREGREVGPVWQRGFFDRVVRTEREADHVRQYIAENPSRWHGLDATRRDGHRM